jgi:hypothetical protein
VIPIDLTRRPYPFIPTGVSLTECAQLETAMVAQPLGRSPESA